MSTVLNAVCVSGIVTALTPTPFPVAGCEILSGGISASTGYVVIDEDRSYYVANTTPDMSTTLGYLNETLALITRLGADVTTVIPALAANPDYVKLIVDIPILLAKIELLKQSLR